MILKNEQEITEYIIRKKGIANFEAFMRFGSTPKNLSNIINKLRNEGFCITQDDNFGDSQYRIMEFQS